MKLSQSVTRLWGISLTLVVLSACSATGGSQGEASAETSSWDFSKPGFNVLEEDGRLWVLRPGEEKSDKHSTMIGAGPRNMTVKALEDETILEYLAAKPGFETEIEDGRLWVLRPGEEKSDKHSTMIGAGPRNMTVKALDDETILEYLAAKPGFETEIVDGRLWVLRPGEEKSDKHSTMIGAGPRNLTVKALDDVTILEYLAAKPGFETEIEDGRLWVLNPGEEKSDKHATAIGVGPRNMTVKALDQATIDLYLAAPSS